MALDSDFGASWFWEFFSVGVAVLTALFGYTLKRVNEVETSLKTDQVDEVHNLRAEISKMEKSFNDRFQEGRDDRNEMWRIIREIQAQGALQHAQNIERISKLPTREEMMQMMERLAGRSNH